MEKRMFSDNCMEQIPSPQSSSGLAVQVIPWLLWRMKVHFKGPTLVHILSKITPVYFLPICSKI
jgi:hypothetical protein